MRMLMAACLAALLGTAAAAEENFGRLGAGVVAGDPLGATARWYASESRSFDFGVGVSGDAVLWADHAWHSWELLPRPKSGRFDAWAGGGLRLELADDAEFGLRMPFGLSYWMSEQPIEFFATAGPVFLMTPHGDVTADGGVGVRYYFAGLR